jgi:hypothetical protein
LPIAYALRISARCYCRDEHGPDDESFFFLLAMGCRSKLRNEPKAQLLESRNVGRPFPAAACFQQAFSPIKQAARIGRPTGF